MTISLERAFVLLSVVEKAGSHNYIRTEALRELQNMDGECKAAQAAQAEKEVAEKARVEEAKQVRLAAEQKKEAEAAKPVFPDTPKTQPINPATGQVDKASAVEPVQEPPIERRV